jgi:membrane protein
MTVRDATSTIRDTARDLKDDHAVRLAAGLSYYATLSLAPLLLLLLAVLGWFFNRESMGTELVAQMRSLVGDAGADIASNVIQKSNSGQKGAASIISFVILVLGASGLFVQLHDAVNVIWDVKAKPWHDLWGLLRTRLVSFGMLLVVAFLMLVSLSVSAALAVLNHYFVRRFPGADIFLMIAHNTASIVIFAIVFAALFKYLPDAIVSWRDVWIGAIVTAVLFTLGKVAIGIYLGHSSVASVYGAAGSIVAWLVWVYYSSLILLIGAEFTQVYSRHFGKGIRPSKHAVRQECKNTKLS